MVPEEQRKYWSPWHGGGAEGRRCPSGSGQGLPGQKPNIRLNVVVPQLALFVARKKLIKECRECGEPFPRQIPASGSIRDAVIVGASASNAREKRRNHLYNVWQQWQQCGSNRG